MFKGLSDLTNLMKQARELQGKAAEMRERLAAVRVTGEAGGGMVSVVANGAQELVSCQVEPRLLTPDDREMLEDLFVAAANQALAKAKEAAAQEMQSLAGGFQLPGLEEAMSRLGLGGGKGPGEG